MEVEKTIYLVRHGQSEANTKPVFQAPDSPLSEHGRIQATSVADRMKRITVERVISSPYPRAKETAEIISSLKECEVDFSELFTERIKPSSILSKPYNDEQANRTYDEWESGFYTSGVQVEDGENYERIVARVDDALQFLAALKESHITVVSHGFFLRTLVARVVMGEELTGGVFKKFSYNTSLENTGISVIQYGHDKDTEKKWRLWILNDHAHLG